MTGINSWLSSSPPSFLQQASDLFPHTPFLTPPYGNHAKEAVTPRLPQSFLYELIILLHSPWFSVRNQIPFSPRKENQIHTYANSQMHIFWEMKCFLHVIYTCKIPGKPSSDLLGRSVAFNSYHNVTDCPRRIENYGRIPLRHIGNTVILVSKPV